MAAQRKRWCSSASSSSSNAESSGICSPVAKKRKRQAKVATFDKWKREFNPKYRTLEWLQCDKDLSDRSLVSTLWCGVCRRYQDKLHEMRNYWVAGSTNHKTSNLVDHATSEQHTSSIHRLDTDRMKATPLEDYAPIVK